MKYAIMLLIIFLSACSVSNNQRIRAQPDNQEMMQLKSKYEECILENMFEREMRQPNENGGWVTEILHSTCLSDASEACGAYARYQLSYIIYHYGYPPNPGVVFSLHRNDCNSALLSLTGKWVFWGLDLGMKQESSYNE